MQAVKPPGSPSSKAHRAPGGFPGTFWRSRSPPFCPMMHQATRGNCPPNSPGRVLPEKKFGGVNVGRRNGVLDVAGRVLPLSDIGPSTAFQAPTSSYPGSLERVLPRRGLELSGRPRATPSSRRGLEVRRAHRPAGLEPTHRPHPSSSQLKATGVSRLQSRGSVKSIVL